ncbi:MFS transporter [Streptomyces tirandamycinicus]|uniref:MFS transporter n=1 Tax=Streptomyces tirandamycinicus TaxID=2174846 RepID=UPI0003AABFE3
MRRSRAFDPRQRMTMALACVTTSVLFSSAPSITLALPTIQRDLDATASTLRWIVIAAQLPLCCLAAASGRLADLLGYRTVLRSALLCFAVASAFCALGPTGHWLIAGRVLQGVAVALAAPLGIALLAREIPLRMRGWALGTLALSITLTSTTAPYLVAALTDFADWRWGFGVYTAAGLVLFVLAGRERYGTGRTAVPMDWKGLLTLTGGLTLVVVSLERVAAWGHRDLPALLLLLAGAALLLLFALVERATADPLIDLGICRRPNVVAAGAGLALTQWASLALSIYLSLYLQQVLGYSALQAGLVALPGALGPLLLPRLVGRLHDYAPNWWTVVGGALLGAVSLMLVALAVDRGHTVTLMLALLAFGFATPLVYTPANSFAMSAVPTAAYGLIGGFTTTARQLGGVLGLAVSGMFFAQVQAGALTRLTRTEGLGSVQQHDLDSLVADGERGRRLLDSLPPPSAQAVLDTASGAYTAGFLTVLLVNAGLLALGSASMLVALRHRMSGLTGEAGRPG